MVPVYRELLADLITPVAAFARLTRSGEPGFLFESGVRPLAGFPFTGVIWYHHAHILHFHLLPASVI